ncbi:MAG: hypothetical protein HY770_08515 [Chitinivibrionia bacterium]|nr:hypothetical protein [Chitinivibrionia bacterium]
MRLALCLILVLGGMLAFVLSFYVQHIALKRYGTADAPKRPMLNPRLWRLSWTASGWFSDARGLKLMRMGDVLLLLGSLCVIVGIVLHDSWFE